jgi:uncharacterized protein (TIGR03435 family)
MFSVLAPAQTTQPKPSFEAASIKPGPPGTAMDLIRAGAMYTKIDDSQFSAGSISLSSMAAMAFRVPQDQVVAPDWLLDTRFDVHAKLPAGSTKEQAPDMLRILLEERFKLVWHRDQKIVPVYALMVAKDGPKLHESPAGAQPGTGGCNGGFHKVCRQITMESLALMLTRFSRANARGALDRPVIDETGLTAKYDFDFDQGISDGGRGDGGALPGDEITAFEAVKALGLRLEQSKHTYDIIVIDHIERSPTEN